MALKSVIKQSCPPDFIVIVDDNQNDDEFSVIRDKLKKIGIPNTFCIRNFRTRNHSGTGAWNAGADFLRKKFKRIECGCIAILDDDDEWSHRYLERCKIKTAEGTMGVFANLVRIQNDFNIYYHLDTENLTVENFLVGNPGVQCSNMFLKLDAFMEIGGFDETFKSCADRDLMVRFLKSNPVENISISNRLNMRD
jgi:glycosyltransferase involved in cell wall biosynthesis